MGSNQQRQAVPLITPQSPVVGTGMEDSCRTKQWSSYYTLKSGEVVKATADEVVVKYKKQQSDISSSALHSKTKVSSSTKKLL